MANIPIQSYDQNLFYAGPEQVYGEILQKYWLIGGKAFRQHYLSYCICQIVVSKSLQCTSYHYLNSDCKNQRSGFLELIYPVITLFISVLILVLSFYLKDHGENSRNDNASSSFFLARLLLLFKQGWTISVVPTYLTSIAQLLESLDLINISLYIYSWFVQG